MFDYINQLMTQYGNWVAELAGGNETMAAFIYVSLPGFIIYALTPVYKTLSAVFKRRCLINLRIVNDVYNSTVYEHWNRKLSEHITDMRNYGISRTRILTEMELVNGIGKSIFCYRGRHAMLHTETLKSEGSDKEKTALTVTTFFWNRKLFQEMLDEFKPKGTIAKDTPSIDYYRPNRYAYVEKVARLECEKHAERLLLNKDTFESLDLLINRFKDVETNERLGLPIKRTVVLYGPPGTAKSTTALAIAARERMDIYDINLSSLCDSTFTDLLTNTPDESLILLEDIDSIKTLHHRDYDSASGSNQEVTEDTRVLTLSGVLNALDGVAALKRLLIVITTNHLDVLDEALTREGRVDLKLELNALEPDTYVPYLKKLTSDDFNPDVSRLTEIRTARLFHLVDLAQGDPAKLTELLYSEKPQLKKVS